MNTAHKPLTEEQAARQELPYGGFSTLKGDVTLRQYNQALNKSTLAFQHFIEPLLKEKLQIADIFSCENEHTPAVQALDYHSCIDYLLLFKGGRMCGLANRILFRDELNHKITLRKSRSNGKPTEYQKLKAAMNNGIYPKVICVSCVADNALKSCAIVRTADLMKFIEETNPPTRTNYDTDKNQTQEYFCFDWRDMQKHGYYMLILADCA